MTDLLDILACPYDGHELRLARSRLTCAGGHDFAVIEGIPFLLRDDVDHPHWAGQLALDVARAGEAPAEWTRPLSDSSAIDGYVQNAVGATNGNLYRQAIQRLARYPIPMFPRSASGRERMLDVGCNWGRWSIAAARNGFDVVGIDPLPEAIFSARRVAEQLGVRASFVVAEARHLPFTNAVFDLVFSFSVLQHLDDRAVVASATEMRRVLREGGTALVQMASAYGLRSLVQVARRGFRPARDFEVRYRRPRMMRHLFERAIGPTTLRPEGYFSLNARPEDLDLLTPGGKVVVHTSSALVSAAETVPMLGVAADSVWVDARAGTLPGIT